MHSIRVICVDSYQAAPIPDVDPTFSHFRGSDIKQVPVIRIFGTKSNGEKVCLHVHGVFPYMYVPYSGQIKTNILVYRLAAALDAAMNVSLGSARSNTQHVFKIQEVSGIPFYGYHRKKHHFLKIYFYNPMLMKRAIDLLQSGRILEQTFQPHEAHIPFVLQFMIDYNIYGMSLINLKSVKYRHCSSMEQNKRKLSSSSDDVLESNVEEKEFLPFSVTRQSICELEMDAWAADIINREVIDKGIDLNPGIAAIWEEEKLRRAQAGLGGDSQLTYKSSPERSQVACIETENDVYQKRRLAQRLCILESQGDDSSLTPNSTYPIPVADDSNLLNASQLEIHVDSHDFLINQRSINHYNEDVHNESIMPPESQNSYNDISLNSSDLNLVDILVNLARNEDDIPSSIDSNSILGSQKSQLYLNLEEEDQNLNIEEEEEEEEVSDLNLTNMQIDSLNFSSWENNKERTQPTNENNESQINLVLESLNDVVTSNSPHDIPQFDGPINDENSNSSNSNEDPDMTIERKEFLICNYKSSRGQRRSRSVAPVTPQKRKRSYSDDEDLHENLKKKNPNDFLPKTPRQSPSKRINKLASPSCPSRTYSPLSLEITCGPRTPKTPKTPKAPKQSPTTPTTSAASRHADRKKLIESFRRKRIFSPVKECHLEEEHASSTDSEPVAPLSKTSSKTSEELFTTDKDTSDKTISGRETPESDKTLVEDSDNSLETIKHSPPQNLGIINETDSNDSNLSKERQSNLTNYNFPHDALQTLLEEEPFEGNEISFSQFIESRQKTLLNQSCSLSSKEESDKVVRIRSKFNPPSREHIINTMESYGILKCDNIQPFFGNQDDANVLPQNQATDPLRRVKGRGLATLAPFRSCLQNVTGLDNWRRMKAREFLFSGRILSSINLRQELAGRETVSIQPLKLPPDKKSIIAWLKAWKNKQKEDDKEQQKPTESQKSEESNSSTDPSNNLSKIFKGIDDGSDGSKHLGISCGQIEFNSLLSAGDVAKENLGNVKALTTYQFISIFCLEVHVITRPNLLPDPRYDSIVAVFYAIHNDVPPDWKKAKPLDCGAVIVDPNKVSNKFTNSKDANNQPQTLTYVESEESIFESLLSIIERCDPEILIGWDIEFLSWGYLFHRASFLGKNLSSKISRIPNYKCNWEAARDQSTPEVHLETLGEVKIPGRIVLDIWRLMRHEIALTSYTYENIMFNVMNERIPQPSFDTLTNWWDSLHFQWRVIDHYSNKVIGIHRILHHLDIINRTSEHARLYGIQFFEVFSRGSQFRVESMMLRLAKPLNYIPVSPSPQQRGCMRAPESLPLIMEPESTMYSDPVIVLDFQSLYPSIIIAYNYCFSTCLGRIEHIGSPDPFEFGTTSLKVPKNLAMKLQNKINFAPCGVAFVKNEVRNGILPRMLTEILETRLMVKKAIKDHPKEDRALQRALDSRQLGLKLIANVTYGYTAANFSGRMPCIEIGDSVVSKGKETLERAIRIVESTSKWGARVIYGDTDSLFVLLKGKSRKEAFNIGAEIADTVTKANPKPVKLKFEKVMQPCILQTKKRYCGYMYENLNDKPVYLAKGIETVRRDGCPAVAKILEKSLRILFETKDVSLVKQYVTRQLDKILTGRVSIQDLTFAKEFRGMKGYKAAACVPALELTKRLIQNDPRAIPRRGERVPYIIVAGGPNEPLIRCVRAPVELIQDPFLRPNATYYITKVIIPPLNRCLNLIGVDAFTWFMVMPHRQALGRIQGTILTSNRKQKTTISQYLCNTTCPSCGQSCDKGICGKCIKNKSQTLIILHEKCRQYERIYCNIKKICESCIGVMDVDSCVSLDCPIFYRRIQAQRDNMQVPRLYDLIECMEHLT